jgi:hypothetical protein
MGWVQNYGATLVSLGNRDVRTDLIAGKSSLLLSLSDRPADLPHMRD